MSIRSETTEERDLLCAIGITLHNGSLRQQLTQHLLESGGSAAVSDRISSTKWREAGEILDHCRELSIAVLPITDPSYPVALRHIQIPPSVLYIKAATPDFIFPPHLLAVVGTRAASVEICQTATRLSREFAEAGFTIVSGLALGIDGAAHRGALATQLPCPTIAVLAHGLNRVYPSSHERLADRIVAAGGALISEYAPGTEPFKHHFLERNRIIAGLCRGVVVIQAGQRSGSLVTARYGADFGRDVLVFQGQNGDERYSGGQQLIEDGATAISSAADLLLEYGLAPSGVWENLSIEEFLRVREVSHAELLSLEMQGVVIRLPGNQLSVWRNSV